MNLTDVTKTPKRVRLTVGDKPYDPTVVNEIDTEVEGSTIDEMLHYRQRMYADADHINLEEKHNDDGDLVGVRYFNTKTSEVEWCLEMESGRLIKD